MFATRGDQENLIHSHNTAAAAKPLNQQSNRLAPKTPAAGRENVPFQTAKRTQWKNDDENGISLDKTVKKETTKLNFITPIAVRDRAPLGAKTTNVKARAFQTPAPQTVSQGLQKTQRRSASARKTKLKIHQSEPITVDAPPLQTEESDDEPDIEYCPPKVHELPNYPSDHEDLVVPQFNFSDILRDYAIEASEEREKKEKEDALRREEKMNREVEEAVSSIAEEFLSADSTSLKLSKYRGGGGVTEATGGATSQLNDRDAARVLSQGSYPRFAAPTSSSLTKRSESTIGYAAGRKVSNSLRPNKGTATARVSVVPKSQRQMAVQNEDEDSDADVFSEAFWHREAMNLEDEEAMEPFKLSIPKYDDNDDEDFQGINRS